MILIIDSAFPALIGIVPCLGDTAFAVLSTNRFVRPYIRRTLSSVLRESSCFQPYLARKRSGFWPIPAQSANVGSTWFSIVGTSFFRPAQPSLAATITIVAVVTTTTIIATWRCDATWT